MQGSRRDGILFLYLAWQVVEVFVLIISFINRTSLSVYGCQYCSLLAPTAH